jgi:hypothetical protein
MTLKKSRCWVGTSSDMAGASGSIVVFVNETDNKVYRNNGESWVPTGGSGTYSPPSGTGWVHVTAGAQDSAASTPTASDVGAVPTSRTVNAQSLGSNITLTTADIADGTDKRYCTDAQKTIIGNTSGSNTGDDPPIGKAAYCYPVVFTPNAAFTTALALAANGGSIAIPICVDTPATLVSVSVRNTDAATARTWRWDLYKDTGVAAVTRVAECVSAESFTPTAASTRTRAASTNTALKPGVYWLVIQSTHATSTFGLGSTAASAAFAVNSAQTKTTANPNGASLDLVAATWTKTTAMYAARLNCAVLGQSTAF